MSDQPSRNVMLYGTEEGPTPTEVITTGALSVVLDAGALRYINMGGVEAIRGIAFLVRDQNWGTYIPEFSDLVIDRDDTQFRISYDAVCADDHQRLSYTVVIEGRADGALVFTVSGKAETDFVTNRTGFTVLHGVEGIAGEALTVLHTDESVEETRFPELIKPSQPVFDIRALTHEAAPGLKVTCVMEGDAYEMEDQRNWTDASFKTYIRPLSKPRPYALEAGANFSQRVALTFEGKPPALASGSQSITISVSDREAGRVPEFALAVDPEQAEASLALSDRLNDTGIRHLFCTFDASAGHGSSDMARFASLSSAYGAQLTLEAVLPLQDEAGEFTDSLDVLKADVEAIRSAAEAGAATFAMISVSPACYHKSYQPNEAWPLAPSLSDVYRAVREAFPNARMGGGMHSYFTELNRKPPPAGDIDFITHTTCPIVHAADDVSVMESLEALPSMFKSTHALGGGKPYWIGPTAIGMRFNPYGAAPMPNPRNVRGAMVAIDPRQRGLFNAAWTLGYVARAASGNVAGLCLSAPTGPFGIAWRKTDYEQPWFDETNEDGTVFPVFHVIAGLAPLAGCAIRDVSVSDTTALGAIAIDTPAGLEVWIANLTGEARTIEIGGAARMTCMTRLDIETFVPRCRATNGFDLAEEPAAETPLELDAYAVVRLRH